MTDLVQRIYGAMCTIRGDHMPVEKFKVKVHPKLRALAQRDMPTFCVYQPQSPDQPERVFGLPLVTDGGLGEDQIVLAYEVEA